MAIDLHLWRNERGFTQMEAARHLGVSQPYLSLLERGARPITDKLRTRLSRADQPAQSPDDKFRAQLSALGYAGFAHIAPARCPEPSSFLMEAISQPDLDARITAALPWLACERAVQIDWPWLVREAKQRDLQNRLGFLTEMATGGSSGPRAVKLAKDELHRARLLAEATCWDSMPAVTREWMRQNRSPEAARWNVVTRARLQDFPI